MDNKKSISIILFVWFIFSCCIITGLLWYLGNQSLEQAVKSNPLTVETAVIEIKQTETAKIIPTKTIELTLEPTNTPETKVDTCYVKVQYRENPEYDAYIKVIGENPSIACAMAVDSFTTETMTASLEEKDSPYRMLCTAKLKWYTLIVSGSSLSPVALGICAGLNESNGNSSY